MLSIGNPLASVGKTSAPLMKAKETKVKAVNSPKSLLKSAPKKSSIRDKQVIDTLVQRLISSMSKHGGTELP